MTGDGDRDGPGDAASEERKDRLDVDAAFAAIVADFGRPTTTTVGPWPAAEDLDPDSPSGGAPDPGPLPESGWPRPVQRAPRHLAPDTPAEAPAPYDDEPQERFEPPEAPPITSTDLASRLAWAGVLGGPLVLLLAALALTRLPTYVVILSLAAFVGGFITLVARLPRDRDEGDGDDGAVV